MTLKESDAGKSRMHGGYGKQESLDRLHSVRAGVWEEKGTYVEQDQPVSRPIEGWEEGFVILYILLSLPLVRG